MHPFVHGPARRRRDRAGNGWPAARAYKVPWVRTRGTRRSCGSGGCGVDHSAQRDPRRGRRQPRRPCVAAPRARPDNGPVGSRDREPARFGVHPTATRPAVRSAGGGQLGEPRRARQRRRDGRQRAVPAAVGAEPDRSDGRSRAELDRDADHASVAHRRHLGARSDRAARRRRAVSARPGHDSSAGRIWFRALAHDRGPRRRCCDRRGGRRRDRRSRAPSGGSRRCLAPYSHACRGYRAPHRARVRGAGSCRAQPGPCCCGWDRSQVRSCTRSS